MWMSECLNGVWMSISECQSECQCVNIRMSIHRGALDTNLCSVIISENCLLAYELLCYMSSVQGGRIQIWSTFRMRTMIWGFCRLWISWSSHIISSRHSPGHSNLNFAHHFVIYWLFQNGANKNQHQDSYEHDERETYLINSYFLQNWFTRQKKSIGWAKYIDRYHAWWHPYTQLK